MYVDGHCPHYSWEHSFDLAPSATCVIAVLLDELRADAKPGGKQSAKGNKRDNISPVTGKPRGPILAPTSHALPLPACVVAGLVLPAKDAFTLAPEATAQHMQPGGKLHFAFLEENRGEAEELLLEQQRQAEEAAEAAAAAEAAEREGEDDEEEEEDEDDAAFEKYSNQKPRRSQRGLISSRYSELLAAGDHCLRMRAASYALSNWRQAPHGWRSIVGKGRRTRGEALKCPCRRSRRSLPSRQLIG